MHVISSNEHFGASEAEHEGKAPGARERKDWFAGVGKGEFEVMDEDLRRGGWG